MKAQARPDLMQGVTHVAALCRLCESVAASLEGQKLGSFTRVGSAVRGALESALTRILTPKRSIDVLREVGRTGRLR